ncbi:MAG: sulfotransferase domain-containing protein [Lewinella sp.]|nr:sulfotransferase domain-containing protein [Lewinella sp.]
MLQKLRKRIQRLDPRTQVRPGDVLIASYPKSGNTWTRFVLGHLLTGCQEQLTFKTFDRYTPELDIHIEYLRELPSPRLIKTHAPYRPRFRKAIYLIRDPRDVYVSYYHYIRKKLPEHLTFKEFLHDEVAKLGTWAEHVQSWQQCDQLLCIQYESILADPRAAFEQMIDFLPEFDLSKEKLEQAIEMSSFQQMKQVEQQYGRNFRSKSDAEKSSVFMRKGEKGDWVNYFDDEDVALLKQRAGAVMKEWGYNGI